MLSSALRAQIDAAAELAAAKIPPLTQDQIGRAAVILRAERGASRTSEQRKPAA